MDSFSNLNEQEKIELLERDQKLLDILLIDFKNSADELKNKIAPLLKHSEQYDLGDAQPFLKLKYQLLVNYCTNLSYYMLLRANGSPLESHPVIEQILEIRTYLEKIRPLEKKLRHKIVNALKEVAATEVDEEALFSDESEDEESKSKPTYTYFEDQEQEIPEERETATAKKAKSLLAKHKITAEMIAEQAGMPREITGIEMDDDNHEEEEFELFRRVKSSKKELKRSNNVDFNEELAELGDFAELLDEANMQVKSRVRREEIIQEDDDEEELNSDEVDGFETDEETLEEDDEEPTQQKKSNGKTIREVYLDEREEDSDDYEHRKITKNIEKNRGLTKSKGKRESSRIRLKSKFSREEKQWNKSRKDGAGNYAGETRGINSNATRGTKL